MALDELNKTGVLGGKKIRVMTEDDRSLGDEAKTAASKLINKLATLMPASMSLTGLTLENEKPVVEGIKFTAAVRPPFQSFLLGPSTVFCVAV